MYWGAMSYTATMAPLYAPPGDKKWQLIFYYSRSPTRPNYKEEEYKQSSITLRYIGNVEHR